MGITDICCPILGAGGSALASVIVACVRRHGRDAHLAEAAAALRNACASISEAIGATAADLAGLRPTPQQARRAGS